MQDFAAQSSTVQYANDYGPIVFSPRQFSFSDLYSLKDLLQSEEEEEEEK